jgi:DNA polymerase III subunit epsilon
LIIAGYDLETTGLNAPEHRIIEVALKAYRFDPTDPLGAVAVGKLVQRIHPERNIEAKAQAVHGITLTDLVGKPTFDQVAPKLSAALNKCDVVVAHNGLDFDFPFTVRELERVGCDIPDFEPFDTMVNGRWATPYGKVPNLRELCFACDEPYNPAEAHAAEYDVDRMMKCFFFGIAHGHFRLSTS